MSRTAGETAADLASDSRTTFDRRARLLLLAAAIVSGAAFWLAAGLFHIPLYPGYGISLMQQPVTSFLVVTVVVTLAVLLGTLIAGSVRFDAGLFCASIGLATLSMRGGSARHFLLAADGPGVYLLLAMECALLGAILLAGWQLQWILHRNDWLKPDELRDGVIDAPQPIGQKLLALLTHAAAMLVAMLLLAQTDQKAQAMLAVGISSLLATLVSYKLGPTQPSPWLWMGSILVAVVGYTAAHFNPAGIEIADPRGALGNLARPLPLDYASTGITGSILGYWLSRRWRANDAAMAPTTPPSRISN